MNVPPVKLGICIPNMGMAHMDFVISLTQMCVFIGSKLFEQGQDRTVTVMDKRTSMLSRSRQECLEDALNQQCTHALFLDTDQSFPADTAHRLLEWKKPVVGCNIALKTMPSFPTARLRGATPFGVPLTSVGKEGIEKVWRVGAGIMMIDLSILKAIPKPWFECRYSDKNQQFVGEDWYFCQKVEEAGHEIFTDHSLSVQVGHVGTFVFNHGNIPVADDLSKRLVA